MSSQDEVSIDAEHIDKAHREGEEAAEDNGVRPLFQIPHLLNDTRANLIISRPILRRLLLRSWTLSKSKKFPSEQRRSKSKSKKRGNLYSADRTLDSHRFGRGCLSGGIKVMIYVCFLWRVRRRLRNGVFPLLSLVVSG